MNRNAIETVMGAVVLVVAAVFLFFAYTTSVVHVVSGYEVTANFTRVEGLRDGGDVRLNGIKVGTIISQQLDPKTFDAVVRLSIDSSIKLPVDSKLRIASSGLLGDKFLSIEPGVDDEILKNGGKITDTTPAINLETLIAQYMFGTQSAQQPKKDGATPPPK
jgi:phospholipid/cholesterol/gamma-HCH transport system substrate-binding protein